MIIYSDAASGWAGWALAHPKFANAVNTITTRGADYATLLLAHPDLKNQAASLIYLILCSTRGVFDVENYDF